MTMFSAARRALLVSLPVVAVLGIASAKAPRGPALVSSTAAGSVPNAPSYDAAVAPNGKFVVFATDSTDIAPAANGEATSIWFRDMKTGALELVSRIPAGQEPDGHCYYPSLSNNGAMVVYQSNATNLVTGDTGGYYNVYLLDRKSGETTRLSQSPSGAGGDWDSFVYGASISGNGKYVVFDSAALTLIPDSGEGYFQIFLYDAKKKELRILSRNPDGDPADGNCYDPSISANGRFVSFWSYASNLAAGASGEVANIYVADVKKGTVTLVSRSVTGGEPANDSYASVVSKNGKVVVFESIADDIVANDDNDSSDLFFADLKKGTVTRVSVAGDGEEADDSSYAPSLSSNGKTLAFYSFASNLVEDDSNGVADIFLRDLKKGTIRRIAGGASGEQGNGHSTLYAPSMSSNGKWVAVTTRADNLVTGLIDGNGASDIVLVPTK